MVSGVEYAASRLEFVLYLLSWGLGSQWGLYRGTFNFSPDPWSMAC